MYSWGVGVWININLGMHVQQMTKEFRLKLKYEEIAECGKHELKKEEADNSKSQPFPFLAKRRIKFA